MARSLSSNCACGADPARCCAGLSGAQRLPIPAASHGEFIFPPALAKGAPVSGFVEGTNGTYVRPTTVSGLLGALAKFGSRAVLVAGCTSRRQVLQCVKCMCGARVRVIVGLLWLTARVTGGQRRCTAGVH